MLHDPIIPGLNANIKLLGSNPPETPISTRIEVRKKDGTVLSGHTEHPKGDIYETPLTDEELLDKFRDNVAYSRTVSAASTEKALDMLKNLDHISDVREVIRLLV
jgi:hypothetical protein